MLAQPEMLAPPNKNMETFMQGGSAIVPGTIEPPSYPSPPILQNPQDRERVLGFFTSPRRLCWAEPSDS